ncbi:hypothetical protein CTAYLR_010638 [Chrysophaeum taylorii]|uniref:Uncharacterized protein n=1 Tax=Chrysophaeum taylorii TaxID=2483200 RepID=A0AAD7XU33_9STRA|nr:hypothetical protein CTAYLR_010638 [Chrysophaeum taylorii]
MLVLLFGLAAAVSSPVKWESAAAAPHEVSAAVFGAIEAGRDIELCLPKCRNRRALQRVATIAAELGGVEVRVRPPVVTFRVKEYRNATQTDGIPATRAWVDEVLAGRRLCPYTESCRRAATGLLPRVAPGPVDVRTAQGAPGLAAEMWRAVCDLATRPEDEIATVLIAAPDLDASFDDFRRLCDDVLEKSLEASNALDIVGRAWFHPKSRPT